MVVILILGLLAAAVGIAVVGAIGDAKNELDAQRLSKFVENFNLSLQTGKNKQYVQKYEGDGKARSLFIEMHDMKLIPLDDMKKLAGVTGTEAPDEDYKKDRAEYLLEENVIFTSVAKGTEMLGKMDGKKATDGVSFCYNAKYLNAYPEKGAVMVFAGTTSARVYTEKAFESEFSSAADGADKTVSGVNYAQPDDLYGKFPFEFIVKE